MKEPFTIRWQRRSWQKMHLRSGQRREKAEKKLNANVDFYSASTYHVSGIVEHMFTSVFAVSRISGWAARVIEQLDDHHLIRPGAEYVGPDYPNRYVAMEKR